MAGQLDECGVALAPHDVLVNRARLARIHRLSLELAIALPQGEVAEHGFAPARNEIVGLVEHRASVAEQSYHHTARGPSGEGDLHAAANLPAPAMRTVRQSPD